MNALNSTRNSWKSHPRRLVVLALAGLILLALTSASLVRAAGGVSVDWKVFGSSGGTAQSGSGEVALDATLGQPVVGSSNAPGNAVTLGAGYWHSDGSLTVYLPMFRR